MRTDDERVLGELLKKALCLASLHVEVEGLGGHRQTQDGTQSQNGGEP